MSETETSDLYCTINKIYRSEIVVKGSKFISFLYPVETEEEIDKYLNNIRSKYHDATHHCYSYFIGKRTDRINRYSDDGEPNGTAGIPIRNALKKEELTDALCIVVRYFGGTKLGVGGLGRAYSDSAKVVLSKSSIIRKFILKEVTLKFPYDLTGAVEKLLNDNNAVIRKRDFDNEASIDCGIRESIYSRLFASFNDVTRGQGQIIDKD